ncbi:MAG: hypothetical protein IJ565_06470 [Bacilli bacterium]|nr:hypothetical protein [Bacilli bacterium]
MNLLESYMYFILRPIENNLKELYKHYYSNKLIDRLNRDGYKELIDKYEKVYLEKLNDYDKIMKDYYLD